MDSNAIDCNWLTQILFLSSKEIVFLQKEEIIINNFEWNLSAESHSEEILFDCSVRRTTDLMNEWMNEQKWSGIWMKVL